MSDTSSIDDQPRQLAYARELEIPPSGSLRARWMVGIAGVAVVTSVGLLLSLRNGAFGGGDWEEFVYTASLVMLFVAAGALIRLAPPLMMRTRLSLEGVSRKWLFLWRQRVRWEDVVRLGRDRVGITVLGWRERMTILPQDGQADHAWRTAWRLWRGRLTSLHVRPLGRVRRRSVWVRVLVGFALVIAGPVLIMVNYTISRTGVSWLNWVGGLMPLVGLVIAAWSLRPMALHPKPAYLRPEGVSLGGSGGRTLGWGELERIEAISDGIRIVSRRGRRITLVMGELAREVSMSLIHRLRPGCIVVWAGRGEVTAPDGIADDPAASKLVVRLKGKMRFWRVARFVAGLAFYGGLAALLLWIIAHEGWSNAVVRLLPWFLLYLLWPAGWLIRRLRRSRQRSRNANR